MEFGNWESMYESIKKDGRYNMERCASIDHFYYEAILRAKSIWSCSPVNFNMLVAEREWFSNCRPYYKVFPSIIETLLKIKLDTKAGFIPNPPYLTMALRFPQNNCLGLASLFFSISHQAIAEEYKHSQEDRGLLICGLHWGEGRLSKRQAGAIVLRSDEAIEAAFERYSAHNSVSNDNENGLEMFRKWLRCVITVCLLAHDPSIIQPDVLMNCRNRFDLSTDPEERQRLIDKARRRGVVGWRIGESYETIPHFRRPHFALRWTEKGHAVPKIVPVKGAVVHRQKLTEVPTGYLTPDGKEVES